VCNQHKKRVQIVGINHGFFAATNLDAGNRPNRPWDWTETVQKIRWFLFELAHLLRNI